MSGFDILAPFEGMASGVAGLFTTPVVAAAETTAVATAPIVVATPIQATSTRRNGDDENDDDDDDDEEGNQNTSTRSSSRLAVTFQSPTSASATRIKTTSVTGTETSGTSTESESSAAATTSSSSSAQFTGIPAPMQTASATSTTGSDVPRLPTAQSDGNDVTPVGYAVGGVLGFAAVAVFGFILYKRYWRSWQERRKSSRAELDGGDAEASAGLTGGIGPVLPRKDTKHKSRTIARQLDENESIDEHYAEKARAAESPFIRISKSFTRFSFGLDQLNERLKSPSGNDLASVGQNSPLASPRAGPYSPYYSATPAGSTRSLLPDQAQNSHPQFSPEGGIATTASLHPLAANPPSPLPFPLGAHPPNGHAKPVASNTQLSGPPRQRSLRQQTTMISPPWLPNSSPMATTATIALLQPPISAPSSSGVPKLKPPPDAKIKRKKVGGPPASGTSTANSPPNGSPTDATYT